MARSAIWTDHVVGFQFSNNTMTAVGRGVQLTYSSEGEVSGNTVHDTAGHGIQFWCNGENFQTQACHSLRFIRNVVRNSIGANIWGTGAVGVIIASNHVDGATDVGLDCEWCAGVTISGNVVRNGHNAGISLFLSCRDVLISDNEVHLYEQRDGTNDTVGLGYGVWLT